MLSFSAVLQTALSSPGDAETPMHNQMNPTTMKANNLLSPVSESSPRVRAVFEVRVDVLVTKDGEIEEAQAGAEEPGRRHHHQWYLECGVWSPGGKKQPSVGSAGGVVLNISANLWR